MSTSHPPAESAIAPCTAANAGDEVGDEMSPESRRELHAVLETSDTEIAAGAPTTTIDELREEWRREDAELG